MKKLFSIAAIVMIGALAFTSCKKSDNSSSSNGSISGTAGTTSFSTNYCSATYTLSDSLLTISGLNLTGSTTNIYPYVGMILHWNGAAGTISLASSTNDVTYFKDGTTNFDYQATSGSVVITSVSSTQITGTYSFTGINAVSGTDSISVTNGNFTAKGTGL